jgi:quercetin dioxygenase-like cupin family protein
MVTIKNVHVVAINGVFEQRKVDAIRRTFTFVFFIMSSFFVFSQNGLDNHLQPTPKIISFDINTSQYQTLLAGEKDSVVFYSGVVTLAPHKSGEIHNTEIYQKMIIPMAGEGQLQITNNKNYDVKFGDAALVPPKTEHHMTNTGEKDFKYIYIAVKSK